jgi:hypothetical protein
MSVTNKAKNRIIGENRLISALILIQLNRFSGLDINILFRISLFKRILSDIFYHFQSINFVAH